MKMLYLLFAAALLTVPGTGFAAEQITVGYRQDARPFVYQDGETFKGFIAEICDRALALADYEVQRVPVDAASRWSDLKSRKVDMLCDTTSVTLARSNEHLFSPIIFLSGVSYAYSAKTERAFLEAYSTSQKTGESAAVSKAQTVHLGPSDLAPYCPGQPDDLQPQMPADQVPLMRVGVLNATTAEAAVRNSETLKLFRLRPGEAICIVSLVGNYAEGMEKLCSGAFAFFFGDRDMLRAYLDDTLNRKGGCDAILSGKFFSYEPYALVVHSDRVDLAVKLQFALFRMFHDGEVDALFNKSFEGRTPSDLVQALFRINAIGRVQ